MHQQHDEWDACTAAPEFHRILMENDSVRVLETIIEPGQTVPMHTHCWPAVSTVLSWSDCIRRNEDGEVVLDTGAKGLTFAPGDTMWSDPISRHTFENVGSRTVHVVTVELKNR